MRNVIKLIALVVAIFAVFGTVSSMALDIKSPVGESLTTYQNNGYMSGNENIRSSQTDVNGNIIYGDTTHVGAVNNSATSPKTSDMGLQCLIIFTAAVVGAIVVTAIRLSKKKEDLNK